MFRIVLAPVALLAVSCAPPSAWNMPPIIGAARAGDTVRLEQLFGEGADPNVRAGVNDFDPLLHAIHKDQEGSVRVLLAHGADVNGRGGGGITPLIMASGYGYTNIVRVLLDHGANAHLTANDGADALARSCQRGSRYRSLHRGPVPDGNRPHAAHRRPSTPPHARRVDPDLARHHQTRRLSGPHSIAAAKTGEPPMTTHELDRMIMHCFGDAEWHLSLWFPRGVARWILQLRDPFAMTIFKRACSP